MYSERPDQPGDHARVIAARRRILIGIANAKPAAEIQILQSDSEFA